MDTAKSLMQKKKNTDDRSIGRINCGYFLLNEWTYDNTIIDAPSSYHTKKSGSDDIKEFLTLLITQMKNQNKTQCKIMS